MIVLCTEWPAADTALARSELERAGAQLRVVRGACAPGGLDVPRVVQLSSSTRLVQCSARACVLEWETPSSTAAERREAISQLVESVRARQGIWVQTLPPAPPTRDTMAVAAPLPAAPPPAPSVHSAWSGSAGVRLQSAPLGSTPMVGVEAQVLAALSRSWRAGVRGAALRPWRAEDVGGASTMLQSFALSAATTWRISPRIRAGATVGATLMHAEGTETATVRGQSGWGATPRVELHEDLCLWRVENTQLFLGARLGGWPAATSLYIEGQNTARALHAVDAALTLGFNVGQW